MKIWLPQLNRVYKTVFDNKGVYIRFSAYGVAHASNDKPIDLTFGVYEDINCKKSIGDNSLDFWQKRKQIYDCEFEDTGVVIERLNEKKYPETLEKLLHTLALKSNKTPNMSIRIKFTPNVELNHDNRYVFRCTINELKKGTYEYGLFNTHYPEIYAKSFTAADVIEVEGKVLGKLFHYVNGEIIWKEHIH